MNMKKIVIASDSFKGSLSSMEVAEAAASAIKEAFPDCKTVCIEMADGGEGFMDSLCVALEGAIVPCSVHDPLGREIVSEYAFADIPGKGMTAVIEMSRASGLTLVPPDLRNPMETSTFGTGELIADALEKGCRNFLIGIGGSATNDGGIGTLTALGWRFLDSEGNVLPPVGASLEKICRIDDSGKDPRLMDCAFKVACDVDTPFCGPEGAAFIFAPQKGAGPEMVETLDKGLESFAAAIKDATGSDVRNIPGAGAAGGLGGALKAFLKAELLPGAEMVLEAVGFDSQAEGADLVITGEGRMDGQTRRGKAPYCVLRHASSLGIPAVAVAGSISDPEALRELGFKAILPINPPGLSIEEALKPETARRNLYGTVMGFLSALTVSN